MSQDLATFRNSVSGRGITRGRGGEREGVSQGEMNYLGMTFPILSIVSHQISWKYDKRSFLCLRRKFLQAGKFAEAISVMQRDGLLPTMNVIEMLVRNICDEGNIEIPFIFETLNKV